MIIFLLNLLIAKPMNNPFLGEGLKKRKPL